MTIDSRDINKELDRVAIAQLNALKGSGQVDITVGGARYSAEFLSAYMLLQSSERLERLTKNLNRLTKALILLTIILAGLTFTLVFMTMPK